MNERRVASAERMRAEFDAGFSHPQVGAARAELDLLLIRCAEQRFALELRQVSALHADRTIVAAPSPEPALLGLAGLRGVVAPVYSLAALLGLSSAGAPRWLLQVSANAPLALAFQHFERHLRVDADSPTRLAPEARAQTRFASGSVMVEGAPLLVLDLLAIFRTLAHARRPGRTPQSGEERP